jgi:CYTH domain-containing protein
MYDIIYIKQKFSNENFKKIKARFPIAKVAVDFRQAQNISMTEMFWVIWDDCDVLESFDFSYTPDEWSKDYIHVFLNGTDYDGICLVPKNSNISNKEISHRFFINKKEVDIKASSPIQYDKFYIDTYDEYLYALENSKTEMFWMLSRNVKENNELIINFYISHHNSYDRNENHAFIHRVDGTDYYNGIFLCSKNRPLTKKEIEHRFIINRKEWPIVASGPVQYDKFNIDTYDEYLYALKNSNTDMFWMLSRNICVDDSVLNRIYVSHDNYDSKTNHAFIHRVKDQDLYNGVFLCSKHCVLTKKEIEHRFIINRKEWPIVASGPIQYEKFNVDTYNEYLYALENSKTEMFWGTSNNIDFSSFDFDVYFTHDNEYDRTINHAFIHRVDGNDLYNGVFLLSKNKKLTQREIEHRFIVNRKEWPIVASGPVQYDRFNIDTYDEYLYALENSKTEMFWGTSNNIKIDDNFLFNIYFTHDNEYDRTTNHSFIHRVNDKDYYNGVFLFSKNRKISEKEINHKFILNRKEWPVVASGPVQYEKFNVDTYDEYLYALENSKTEMFWIIPSYVNPTTRFKYDTYFTHDNTYDRTINHAYLNGKYNDGILLCSKQAKFSKRELDYRFIAHKKEVNVVISTPALYDIVFISYQEPNADEYYKYLIARFPRAKRVHGVKGIHQAHIEAAKLCSTDMFWIVDGDALVESNFKFDYQVPRWDKEMVHVWRSVNPINDLVYGYGGIKLFPTELTINMDTSKPDMTTSISSKFKAVQEISNVTGFNTDPFNTWKSAFRECTKLSSKIIDRQKDTETQNRLQTWCTTGKDRPFGKYAIDGAKFGALFGARNKDSIETFKKINDFNWLKEQFDARNI